jgi:hypothetical protein
MACNLVRLRFASPVVIALLATFVHTRAESAAPPAATRPPSNAAMTAESLLSQMVEHDRRRAVSLLEYSANRRYQVTNRNGKLRLETQVSLRYQSPDSKEFKILSESGPALLRNMIKSLLNLEVEATLGPGSYASSITPANYTFQIAGKDTVDGYSCFVVQAILKRKDKYLFQGKIWIDDNEFAIVRIVGRPAERPSFWIKSADFTRHYQKIGEIWLPLRDETVSQVRIFGENVLTIDHGDYNLSLRQEPTPSEDQLSLVGWREKGWLQNLGRF